MIVILNSWKASDCEALLHEKPSDCEALLHEKPSDCEALFHEKPEDCETLLHESLIIVCETLFKKSLKGLNLWWKVLSLWDFAPWKA
jgi:hypothetical protein